ARAAPPALDGSGQGRRVAVVGGGIAGLTAAYELAQRGYEPIVLEARERPGGRVCTLRRGSRIEHVGRANTQVAFDEGLTFNAGAWRIPHHHTPVFHYLRRFGVPVQVLANDNERGWVAAGGRRYRLGQLRADFRGNVAELVAKAADAGWLDASLTRDDAVALAEYLVGEVGLRPRDYRYVRSARRGYDRPPSAWEAAETGTPRSLADVLQVIEEVPHLLLYGLESAEFHAPMFEVVGGMARLADAFVERLGPRVVFGAEVVEFGQDADGVVVAYTEAGNSKRPREVRADFGILTVPASVFLTIPGHVSPETRAAMASITYEPAAKVGIQMGRRFWEEDDAIYGGHSYAGPHLVISYPSDGFLSEKGIVQALYLSGADAVMASAMDDGELAEWMLGAGDRVHPGAFRRYAEHQAAVFWHLDRHSLGAWASHDSGGPAPRLAEPDGRWYFAGEHLSHMRAWMAGAIESAWSVVERLHARSATEATP
ncbi:MAG TPA: FAD-dependent oxidoreductase, partial [Acidimicrobiia bacterium]|nr:FAD-dependent oxidoreductase [Acidimicrobiia bacterium]